MGATDTRRPTPSEGREAPGIRGWKGRVKRMLDVTGATLFLALLSPLLVAIACWVKLDSPGPVIYGQERVGHRGRRFRCLKFRSMRAHADRALESDPLLRQLYLQNDHKLPARLDPRLTRSGRFLRRSSLDELPQLVNVLRGEMSLVGPRPVTPEQLPEFGDQELLLSVRPGMTGAWAANGRTEVGFPERARLELDYVRHWWFGLDFVLLLKTIPALFRWEEVD